MPVWQIQPVAHPSDPRWQGRSAWEEVIVRAPSAAIARTVAARLEVDPSARGVGNESSGPQSGFADEKLYWVRRLDSAAARRFGNRDDMSVLAFRHSNGRSSPQQVGDHVSD